MGITYKTNRFHMPLLQVVGNTAVQTTFNACFCLVSDKDKSALEWALSYMKTLLEAERIPQPSVVVTDLDQCLTKAVKSVLPATTHHQICVQQFLKKTASQIKSMWRGPVEKAPVAPVDDAGGWPGARGGNIVSGVDWQAGTTTTTASTSTTATPTTADDEAIYTHNPDGFTAAWKAVVHAPSEAAFWNTWRSLKRSFEDQEELIAYFEARYLPSHSQFAAFKINRVRSYGVKTASLTQGGRRGLSSHILRDGPDLEALHQKFHVMVFSSDQDCYTRLGAEHRRWRPRAHSPMLKGLTFRVPFKALDLLYEEYMHANNAFAQRGDLPSCTGNFQIQWGLPCRHELLRRLHGGGDGGEVTYDDIDSYWWLDQGPLDLIAHHDQTRDNGV
ncbi:MULE transposase domain-containing protein [Colletotrichum graminicola]|nr:MULE transposase domain-containing protein [Colletotrichum graminicola]